MNSLNPESPRLVRFIILGIVCLILTACGDRNDPPKNPGSTGFLPSQPVGPLRDEIPPDQLAAVIDAHYRALGAMERYEYAEAARLFREVHRRAPGWTIGAINLAIALLNQGGEAKQESGGGDSKEKQGSELNIEAAQRLLDQVIAQNPNQPYALFARGIILRSQGQSIAAHRDFARVTELDPADPHAWLEFGGTITNPEREGMPAERRQAPELIAAYTKALEANPYLVTAMFKLQQAYNLAGDQAKRQQVLAQHNQMNPKPPGNPASTGEVAPTIYGEMGKYAQVINPFPRPTAAQSPAPAPRFGSLDPLQIRLAEGDRWAGETDFVGRWAAIGRARGRFGAGLATFDVNRDGRLDLYLTAAIVGPLGLHDALLINSGEGKFEDRTAAYGLPMDRAGLGVAAGDFDADLNIDLYVTGINDNRLLRQENSRFVDVTQAAGVGVPNAITLTARWFDLDQDGDLDLYVVNYSPASGLEEAFTADASGPGLPNVAFRNDGQPSKIGMRPENNWAPLAVATADLPAVQGLSIAFSTAWPSAEVLGGGVAHHSGFVAFDVDDDRDFDYVLTADDRPATVLLNDRAGQFHVVPLEGWQPEAKVAGLLVTDVDRDGRSDVVATGSAGRVFAWRNETSRVGSVVNVRGQRYPINAIHWRSAVAVDLDLDTWSDLVGLAASGRPSAVEWARNQGTRFENSPLHLVTPDQGPFPASGFALGNLVGDDLPDLIVCRDGEAPRLARNLGNGLHWLVLDLAGRWKTSFDQMRTNSEGLGTRISLEGEGLYVPVDYASPEAGTAQSVAPMVLGLGPHLSAPLLRVRWPDGVMQSELNVTADKTLHLVELSRKTGSCPILFTWNGERFVCLGDFAGAAGLGFLEAPGEYHRPDRDEAMAITPTQLQAVGGILRLSVVEPMDEVAYLDRLVLDVVDRPPGVQCTPDERFAFGASEPSGQLIAWNKIWRPIAAVDHVGRDVLSLLQATDRRSVDQFDRINGWIGYTEDHALTLDFGEQLPQVKPGDEPILCLTGWVEYPYSQTNYAAATAGVPLQAPILEQQMANGHWQVIDSQPGHPAGLTRMMTLNLAGKLRPEPRCILRLRSNMECYWDEALIALKSPLAEQSIRTTSLPVAQARLRDRGYLRESSPDGLKPVLPDYDRVDPVPLARLQGTLTRHGDVASLLRGDDDLLCVMGPGDEVQLEFDGRALPILEPGWTRMFVFRSVAYCKDADPFTATSDSVEPLPWQGMPAFPFPAGLERPTDPAYRTYLRDYQTRPAGAL